MTASATSPADLQSEFAAALRSTASDAAPVGFDATAARRFRVYRNNVRMAQREALAANYPAVRRIVGDGLFAMMADRYAMSSLPRERTLNFYGAGFADFVAAFDAVRDLPYLADVARLERAVLEARHAADADPLDPALVAALGAALTFARLVRHPAARLVRSDYPIADMWQANADDTDTPGMTDQVFRFGASGALVTRPHHEVRVRAIDPANLVFITALFAGDTIGDAHAQAVEAEATFDVTPAFRDLLAAGAFRGIAADTSEKS
jgi:hypothetical protein